MTRLTLQLSAARVFVDDLGAAQAFYRDALGLPLRAGGPGYCVFGCGGVDLVVETVASDAPADERCLVGRLTGLSFQVADVHAAYELLRGRGVAFADAPERQAWGGTLATCRDPAGNALQLVELPPA